MLTPKGIRVLEFNCRFGDPETQVVLPLLETDLVEIAEACVDGRLKEVDVRWKSGAAVCVVLASKGYPEKPEKGQVVSFSELPEDMICFHAGTKQNGTDVVTAGGRVFGLTSYAKTLNSAIKQVYANIDKVSFEGVQYRNDIAYRALFVETDGVTDFETDKRMIADVRGEYRTSKLVSLPTDQLTYTVNGLAMQVHNELGAGHAEKFYQRRLADLCEAAGILLKQKSGLRSGWMENPLVISNWIYGLMNDLLWNVNRFHIRLALMKWGRCLLILLPQPAQLVCCITSVEENLNSNGLSSPKMCRIGKSIFIVSFIETRK